MPSTWGNTETKFFYELTPEKILDSVEDSGLRCTGRCLPLNSFENRVYEIEIEVEDESQITSPSDRFRVAKFYRPGRWTKEQILEEHQFLNDLRDAEIPVVAPEPFQDGSTLHELKDAGIWYTVFPKQGGRNPDELSHDQYEQVGRLLARMHQVGESRQAEHRIAINPSTYGKENLEWLLKSNSVPIHLAKTYEQTVHQICDLSAPLFEGVPTQRIHGDCHLGNLIWGSQGPFWVDFDDMVRGPCVQDLWLMVPGREGEARQLLESLLEGYTQMKDFPRTTLNLIEPLRALRFIHFSAWIAKRWSDPAFPKAFPNYGSDRYWDEQLQDLKEQLALIQNPTNI